MKSIWHGLAMVCLALGLLGLAGCASDHAPDQHDFKVVGERTYDNVPFEHMYTLAMRTMRDLHLTRKTITKEETEAFLVFDDPEVEYGEVAMDIRPSADDGSATHVTLFAHDQNEDTKTAATHILDNLDQQIKMEHDLLPAR